MPTNIQILPERDEAVMQQYQEKKKFHPDWMLIFRCGDFYECVAKDAVSAAKILDLTVHKWKTKNSGTIEVTGFPNHELETYLPKLVRAGQRVAICEQIEAPIIKTKNDELKNNDSMTTEKKENIAKDAKVEEAKKAKKTTTRKATAKTKTKTTAKAETKAKKEVKKKTEKVAEAPVKTTPKSGDTELKKQEDATVQKQHQPREPQMVTVNGARVTHGHIYQAKNDESTFYFSVRLDGQVLKPQRMWHQDVEAFKNKEIGIPELMQKYYPTKLQPQLSPEAFKAAKQLPDGSIIEKFNVYKEKNPESQHYGKWFFYAQVGDKKMSAVASYKDLNAYFDRTLSPAELVVANFGEKLQLIGAYDKYQLPDGFDNKSIRVVKNEETKRWQISADLGEKGMTSTKELSYDDAHALIFAKVATRPQIAAKYLGSEISDLMGKTYTQKVETSAKVKL